MTWRTTGLETLLQKSLEECDGSLTEGTGFGDGWIGNGIGSCYDDEHDYFYQDLSDGWGDGDDYGDAEGDGVSTQ
jgi:hypothetical protein